MHKEESFILRIMELGAKGFLQKDVEIDQIENALYSIRDTGYYFTTALSRVMAKNIARNDKVTPFYFESKLTDREIEVLTLICEECTSTEIGERLYISPRTVENHRTRLLEKTGVKNTVGLVVYAIKRGYFDV